MSTTSSDQRTIKPYYKSSNSDFLLAHGDTFKLLPEFDFKFDMVFADPPYFLSNGGISLQSGKVVSVNKGKWDRGRTPEEMMTFNREWLNLCRDKLKDNGTIWVSGQLSDRTGIQDTERSDMAEDQSSREHLLPLLYLFYGIHHLGAQTTEETA